MANRFQTPFPEFYDDAGDPREGARLFFFITGTSTKLDTYSDAARAVANTNPIVLNEFGRPDVAIFLKDQDYKVVLAPPGTDDPITSTPIWTADPVRPSDIIQMSIRKVGSGTPNGSVAGTAGSAGVMPTEYWDYTNNILYECTTTGTASTAVWTAINSTSNAAFFEPAGRLTLTSGAPIMAADVTAGTAVYYSPFTGNAVPIYNGSTFTMLTFTELTLTLHSSHTLNGIFDVFVINDSGVVTLVTGPAWSVATAGSGARGAGAGTTQLTRTTGFYTNAVSMTGRNGTTTYTVGANRGLYVGSLYIDGTAGQISTLTAAGQARKYGIWNAFNRTPIIMLGDDPTSTWNYTTLTYRSSNNSASNYIDVFSGLAEEPFELVFRQISQSTSNSNSPAIDIGIGVNSTTSPSGFVGDRSVANSNAVNLLIKSPTIGSYTQAPALGVQRISPLERGAISATFYGGTDGMQLATRYRG